MVLTKEFIEMQGFQFKQTHDKHIHVFCNHNKITNNIYVILWDDYHKNISITKYDDNSEDDEPTYIYNDKIYSCFELIKILLHNKYITNGKLIFPIDFVDTFMTSKYQYNETEFHEICDVSLLMLLSMEHYEKCQPFLTFRKNYINKNGWKYTDIDNAKFKDYSKITNTYTHI